MKVELFDVSWAMALILLCSCGILQQLVKTFGDRLSDAGLKIMLFLWTLFVLVVIGMVSSGVSVSILH
ncbi:MAG: hypothetical protein P4N41_00180 [Negativicutes bacterium]|nr:hypothetical protein [Negativicutes bacterium]MDR3588061.1 hypothetical protein [Negativicutes bacterium]